MRMSSCSNGTTNARGNKDHNIRIADTNERFMVNDDPVLYLGILCDELSTWERFPASKNLTIYIYLSLQFNSFTYFVDSKCSNDDERSSDALYIYIGIFQIPT
jgi:hypothetical protein